MKTFSKTLALLIFALPLAAQTSTKENTLSGLPPCPQGTPSKNWTNCDGKVRYPSGATYEGAYIDGKHNGKGKYVTPEGVTYEGNHRDNKRNGRFVITYADGKKREATYEDNQLKSDQDLNRPQDRFASNKPVPAPATRAGDEKQSERKPMMEDRRLTAESNQSKGATPSRIEELNAQVSFNKVFYIDPRRGFNRAESKHSFQQCYSREVHYKDRWHKVFCTDAFILSKGSKIGKHGDVYSLIYSTNDYSVHKRFDGHFRLEFHCTSVSKQPSTGVLIRLLPVNLTKKNESYQSSVRVEFFNQTISEMIITNQRPAGFLDYPGTHHIDNVVKDIDRRNAAQQKSKQGIEPFKLLGSSSFSISFNDAYANVLGVQLHSLEGISQPLYDGIINILDNRTDIRGATVIIDSAPTPFSFNGSPDFGLLMVQLDMNEIRGDYRELKKRCTSMK